MKILIFTQYYFPETGATSNRAYSLAKTFQDVGHEVRVIAERPNHPAGIFHKGFEKGIFIDGEWGGVPVTWTWVHTKQVKGFLDRILFYLSYMIMAVFAVFRLRGRFDVIIATSPPLFVGISGWAAAKIKRAKFVFDVRDLWPEVAVKMGELTNPKVIKIAERIELFLYRKADIITPVTNSFLETIALHGIDRSKMKVIPNGTIPADFYLNRSSSELRNELVLPLDKFIVTFAGNMGLAQGLDHIIEGAKLFESNNDQSVLFLFVGDGPRKKRLLDLTSQFRLTNVMFVDRVPTPIAIKYLNASDALLVPLGNDPVYSKFIPSKLFDSMAAGKPVLLSVDGEARSILEESKGGLYYEAENAEELYHNIRTLQSNQDKSGKMGKLGRDFVKEKYSRDVQARKMLSFIQDKIY